MRRAFCFRDLFEFFRNSSLNSRDFFAPGSDGLKRNQFGGTVGGPIVKDKLFVFLGYQGTTIRQNLVNGTAYDEHFDRLLEDGRLPGAAHRILREGRDGTLRAQRARLADMRARG